MHDQLACRGKHERARGGGPVDRRLQKTLQDRNKEGRGLAGARLGARNHIISTKRERNHAALHRSRLAPAQVSNALQEPLVEHERVKRNRGFIKRYLFVRRRFEVALRQRGWVRASAACGASAATTLLRWCGSMCSQRANAHGT